MSGAIEAVGNAATRSIERIGNLMLLAAAAVAGIVRRPFRAGLIVAQFDFIGVGSLFIVGLTGLFSGMVLALQGVYAFGLFNAQSMVGATVELSLAREIAPVFTALFVTARVGSAIATELGTMRVTEQIDALETMAVDPVHYLVTPRVLAGTIMAPFLTMFFNTVGLLGCWLITIPYSGLPAGPFWSHMQRLVVPGDLWHGLWKSIVFGAAVTSIACYCGYSASGGARGVGRATTSAVVGGSVTVLALDLLLTALTVGKNT